MKRLIIYLSFVFFYGCGQPLEKYREVRPMMGTDASIDVCLSKTIEKEVLAKAYKAVWMRLEDIAWRMNRYDERSDLAKINNAKDESVQVGEDTYQLLLRSRDYKRYTWDAFDVTILPLIHFWKNVKELNPHTIVEMEKILKDLGLKENVEFLSDNHIRKKNPKTQVDFGGIAAGYALDEAARIFREYGIMNFYIDIGGDIYAGGLNCRGEKWRVGIRNPKDKTKILDIVAISDQGITTSGNYERYIEVNGERLSHIIDPKTGYPQKQVTSATFIAPTAEEADVYATAICILGHPEGIKWIDMLFDYSSDIKKSYAGLILILGDDGNLIRYESEDYKNFKVQ